MKQALKKILKHPKVIRCGSWVVAKYITLVFKTSSWIFINDRLPRSYWQTGRPFIVCFWHNRLLMSCFAWQSSTPFHMLISSHPDGRIIAETVGFHGIHTISGSSSRGGAKALRTMLQVLKQGATVGITPDGPRGPRFHVSDGVLSLAKLSGLDILCVTYATSRRKILNSWDRFVFALPFSKGVIAWSGPFSLSRQASRQEQEAFRVKLQKELTALTEKADTLCGLSPIQ